MLSSDIFLDWLHLVDLDILPSKSASMASGSLLSKLHHCYVPLIFSGYRSRNQYKIYGLSPIAEHKHNKIHS